MSEVGRLRLPPPAADSDPDGAGRLGGKLETPRRSHGKASNLGNNSAEPRMPQPLLETGKNGFLVARLDIDYTVGRQPGLRYCRRKEIRPGHAPKHLPACAGRNTGREQCCCRAIDRAIATAGHLMQPAKRQSTSGQHPVNSRDAEGEYQPFARASAFETRDALAKI